MDTFLPKSPDLCCILSLPVGSGQVLERINALCCLVEARFIQLYWLGLVLGIRNLKFTVPSLWADSPGTREIQR